VPAELQVYNWCLPELKSRRNLTEQPSLLHELHLTVHSLFSIQLTVCGAWRRRLVGTSLLVDKIREDKTIFFYTWCNFVSVYLPVLLQPKFHS
jgi:hypothetical protein